MVHQANTLTPIDIPRRGVGMLMEGEQDQSHLDGPGNSIGPVKNSMMGPFLGVDDFSNSMSFERRAQHQFNNSMVSSIYQSRPGATRRTKKSQSSSSTQQYSAYAQKFTRRAPPSDMPVGFSKFLSVQK